MAPLIESIPRLTMVARGAELVLNDPADQAALVVEQAQRQLSVDRHLVRDADGSLQLL